MDHQVFWAIVAVTGWGVAWVATRRWWHYRALAEDISQDASNIESKYSKQLKKLRDESDSAQKELEKAKASEAVAREGERNAQRRADTADAEAKKQTALAQERFDLIEGILEEKNLIWRMYRDSTRQAGVAQGWLMREYSSALQVANVYRARAGEPEITAPAQLRELVSEYAAKAAAIPDTTPSKDPSKEKQGTSAGDG